MADEGLQARRNADGSLEVWLEGRRLHFPGGRREPTVSEGLPPPDAGPIPSDVLVDVGDPVTMVSYDGWYARVSSAGVDVNRTRARRWGGRVFSRKLGRHGS